MLEGVLQRVLQAVFGGGSNLLPHDQERLASYEMFHRYGLKPSDFFYSGKYDIDTNWTDAGFTNPDGEWLMCYSKKTWLYPALSFECIWPTLGQPNLVAVIGMESGGRFNINLGIFQMVGGSLYLATKGVGGNVLRVEITNFLPANYDTAMHRYGLKLNKCNLEGYIDDVLVGIILLGIPDAIPAWPNNPPYAICSSPAALVSARVPSCVLLEPGGAKPSYTLGINWSDYQIACNDGDPLPPRQYALYTENTTTKWKALATAGAVLTSHPVPVWGYPVKTLVFQADAAGNLDIQVYSGGGWRSWVPGGITLVANQLEVYNLNGDIPIARCVYTPTNADTITLAEWYLS